MTEVCGSAGANPCLGKDTDGGAADKRGWPDMRSLRWPPEGVELDPEAKANSGELVPPVEFAADPAGSGMFVAVPVGAAAVAEAEAETEVDAAGVGAVILTELRALRKAVEDLSGLVRALSDSGRVGVSAKGGASGPTRSISDHQGRQEIQEYFLNHAGCTVYPKEIAEALNLPVLKVAELCETMALRGQIARTPGG